ncbi:hypothetical protein AAIB46_21280 [Streptomyces sp. 35M1]|uniref:hypothetical protein n=1 Tax=Streptomyces sp. 35M1 TaxID=3142978 RepID=UPI00399097C1
MVDDVTPPAEQTDERIGVLHPHEAEADVPLERLSERREFGVDGIPEKLQRGDGR